MRFKWRFKAIMLNRTASREKIQSSSLPEHFCRSWSEIVCERGFPFYSRRDADDTLSLFLFPASGGESAVTIHYQRRIKSCPLSRYSVHD